MAYNALYGYDTALQGNTLGADGRRRDRQYPAWMTDMNARGIGIAENYTPTVPGFIDIPRYNAPPAAPVQDQFISPPVAGFAGGTLGGEGSGGMEPPGAPGDMRALLSSLGGYFGFGGTETAPAAGFDTGPSTGAASGGSGGYGGGAPGGGYGSPGDVSAPSPETGYFFHGGEVTRNSLGGPNPPGPDDGYAALNVGEGVITAAAMKHYGPAFLARLNKLTVPKGSSNKK